MKKQLTIMVFAILSIAIVTSAANAETICETSLTGYTFMGGGMGGFQTEEGDVSGKNYFLVGSSAISDGMWSFGWLKFDNADLPAAPVPQAYLALDFYASGAMGNSTAPVTMDVAIQAVDSDVSGILSTDFDGDSSLGQSDLVYYVNNHILDGNVAEEYLTNVGIYYWDITSLVNGWINDPASNKGFVVTGWGNGDTSETGYEHMKFAGFPIDGVSKGMVPTLTTTTAVPEPSTFVMVLAALACSGMMLHRKRHQAAK